MSLDADDFDDGDAGEESGDLFGQVVMAVSAAHRQLLTLQSEVKGMPACAEFADALSGLVRYLEEMEEAVHNAIEMDFVEQDQFVDDLAEERAGGLADGLREAGAVFQLVPWAENGVPDARSAALTSQWELASDTGWHLHNKLTEVI